VLIQDVNRLLGHLSISETEAAYAYLAPDRMQPEVNMICRVIIQKTPIEKSPDNDRGFFVTSPLQHPRRRKESQFPHHRRLFEY